METCVHILLESKRVREASFERAGKTYYKYRGKCYCRDSSGNKSEISEDEYTKVLEGNTEQSPPTTQNLSGLDRYGLEFPRSGAETEALHKKVQGKLKRELSDIFELEYSSSMSRMNGCQHYNSFDTLDSTEEVDSVYKKLASSLEAAGYKQSPSLSLGSEDSSRYIPIFVAPDGSKAVVTVSRSLAKFVELEVYDYLTEEDLSDLASEEF